MREQRSEALRVYAGLLALTGATVASSFIGWGRLAAVAAALAVASTKGILIGWHYMHLKEEGPLIWGVALAAVATALVLVAGLAPDLAVARP
jgi:caa(3)-type oxidase subunit IV